MADILLRRLVEGLAGQHGALLDLEAELQQRGEGVGEVADAEGADQTAEVSEVGNGTSYHEGEGPVDGHHENPDGFAPLGGERREVCRLVLAG